MVLLMAEILHQLIGSLPHFYAVLYIPSGAGFLPSTVFMVFVEGQVIGFCCVSCLTAGRAKHNRLTCQGFGCSGFLGFGEYPKIPLEHTPVIRFHTPNDLENSKS